MKSVYALIPAALLAGTVLSVSAEAKRMEDPSVHAERLDATQKYFKNKLAKRQGNVVGAGSIETHRTKRVAGNSLKSHKFRVAAVKRHKHLTVAATKQTDAKIRKVAHFDATSMSKVLRSGPRPRDLQRLAEAKTLMPDQALQTVEGSDERVISAIREMAPSFGVPTWFALRIANVESGYNPHVRGRAGEIGVYQLKCDTARGMGFTGDCSQLFDARTNVLWGLKHLSLAIQSSNGDLQLAASKHNGGLGRKSLVLSYIAKVF